MQKRPPQGHPNTTQSNKNQPAEQAKAPAATYTTSMLIRLVKSRYVGRLRSEAPFKGIYLRAKAAHARYVLSPIMLLGLLEERVMCI